MGNLIFSIKKRVESRVSLNQIAHISRLNLSPLILHRTGKKLVALCLHKNICIDSVFKAHLRVRVIISVKGSCNRSAGAELYFICQIMKVGRTVLDSGASVADSSGTTLCKVRVSDTRAPSTTVRRSFII